MVWPYLTSHSHSPGSPMVMGVWRSGEHRPHGLLKDRGQEWTAHLSTIFFFRWRRGPTATVIVITNHRICRDQVICKAKFFFSLLRHARCRRIGQWRVAEQSRHSASAYVRLKIQTPLLCIRKIAWIEKGHLSQVSCYLPWLSFCRRKGPAYASPGDILLQTGLGNHYSFMTISCRKG